jgi:hypothetical protein
MEEFKKKLEELGVIDIVPIGDVHGTKDWKKLVDENKVNVFLGDYFDPYFTYNTNSLITNFNEIIDYKKKHNDNVILLLGNHDFHYLFSQYETYSRYRRWDSMKIRKAIMDNINYFHGVAYSYNEKYLLTHAGVSKEWYEKRFKKEYEGETLKEIEDKINGLWWNEDDNIKFNSFSFNSNSSDKYDYYGDSCTHSPMWVRWDTIINHNLLENTDFVQIFGHTGDVDIRVSDDKKLIKVDLSFKDYKF